MSAIKRITKFIDDFSRDWNPWRLRIRLRIAYACADQLQERLKRIELEHDELFLLKEKCVEANIFLVNENEQLGRLYYAVDAGNILKVGDALKAARLFYVQQDMRGPHVECKECGCLICECACVPF